MDIKQHFQQLLTALQIERKEEQEQYRLLTENAAIKERVEAGITLYPLEFLSLNFNDSGDLLIDLKVNPSQEATAFGTGKTISLFNAEGEQAEGQMLSLKNQIATIRINDEGVQDWIKKGKIGLNALVDTKTYELYEKTIKRILNEDKYPLLQDFYQVKHAHSPENYTNNTLNSSQEKAIGEILSENTITLVHGPPGTGKTTTLVAAIKALSEQKKRILLCAPSNTAVDNVCTKLLKEKINVVRIGNEAKIDDSVAPAYLENRIKTDRSYKTLIQLKTDAEKIREQAFKFRRNFGKEEYQERKRLKVELKSLKADIRKIQNDIARSIINDAQVIAGTFYGVQGIAEMLNNFDYVFIDEAGQAIEPGIWSVAHFGNKLVLAGDDLQLPPTVKSFEAERLGLGNSLLQRASEIDFPKYLLNVQYRMHQKIMEFSNQQFYEGKLVAHESVATAALPGNEHEPVEFIDTAGCGFEEKKDLESGGITNEGEIKVLLAILKEYNPDKHDIGVITPYRAQLIAIEDALHTFNGYANTVDSFQGQEREVILISLVRSNESGEIGFLKDYRRMNVAMTRAQKKLVIIGDSATIGQDSFYNAFLEYVEKNGSYRTAWEFS
ncbi:MAG: Flp pilus assembly complex ATPase component TadA [Crocinitomicaceae bacterium]|nr:Flp pilus assembly complex ATPase component TadA [Crocinitomicaceae bacterium]